MKNYRTPTIESNVFHLCEEVDRMKYFLIKRNGQYLLLNEQNYHLHLMGRL